MLRVDEPIVNTKEIYKKYIKEAATEEGIPEYILYNLIKTESNFNKDAISPAGAKGLAQFMPETAKQYKVDVTDPLSSIKGAAKMLKNLNTQLKGNWNETLAAYNWGIGNLQKKGIENAPLETKNYITKILGETTTPSITPSFTPSINLPEVSINYGMIEEFKKMIEETKQIQKEEKENVKLSEAKNKLIERDNAIKFIKELKLNYTQFKPGKQ